MPRAKTIKGKPGPKKAPEFVPPFSERESEQRPPAVPHETTKREPEPKNAAWQNTRSQCVDKTKATCAGCGHGPHTHYGSDTDWCNERKCRCQGWTE